MSDVYVVINLATTCDESSNYVAKDSTEIIELAWQILDAETLTCLNQDSILIRPANTPITPYCTNLYNIDWEHVRNAGSFKEAISKFDSVISSYVENKQFSFVTFDIFKLRVQLSREARDKSVVLPLYLQHPRIFDLQQEYCNWQATHPEALSYTCSSISNIMTALDVSDVDSNLESSGSENGSDSGKSTVERSINLYAKILAQLIKKSLPVSEHPQVLTKPYDSSQDVKVFLTERSKILFLSNLPADTTQSELESWFTQYGGRPIAFWTLKNVELNDSNGGANGLNNSAASSLNSQVNKKAKGISGFAVFATHEEATESLSMNGRVLNDRPIEVQPSSTRVLDNASDLLTPFPPSKNRPRPGDWTCPSCGFSNFQRRTHCFRCSFPASSAVAIQESMYSGRRGNNNNSNNTNSSNGNSNNNSSDKLSYNPSMAKMSGSGVLNNQYFESSPNYSQSNTPTNNANLNNSNMHNNHHHHNNYYNCANNNNNNNSNTNNNNRGHYGNNVPFRAGDWKCDLCMYHNFAKNLCCLKCSAAKPIISVSNQHNAIHSVNSTAAAIAAATASGQPLNLNSGFIGLQQPQPHHVYNQQGNQGQGQSQGQNQGQILPQVQGQGQVPNQNSGQAQVRKSLNNVNMGKPNQQFQSIQGSKNYNVRGSSNVTPQPNQQQQHYSMASQPQMSTNQTSQSYKFSQSVQNSVQNSPGLYTNYTNQGQYTGKSGNNSAPAMMNNDSSSSINSNIPMNPTFSMITGQMGGLSLNQ